MVSIQFLQGINTKSLARFQNGAHKPFKTGITETESKTLTYEFCQCDFNIKRQILKL